MLKLAANSRGSTIVEFALIAPVMCLFLVGSMDVAHTLYMEAALQGVIQNTARAGTLEGGQLETSLNIVDERVRANINKLAANATTTISRRFYSTYTQAQRQHEPFTDMASAGPDGRYTEGEAFVDTNLSGSYDDGEPFTDTLSAPDGTCNNGEAYTDENGNSRWEADLGRDGQGGAKDAVVYTVRVEYPATFPLWKLIGGSDTKRVTATTVLRNQPYGDQEAFAAPQTRACT